jgi:group I intron endonuclease
MYTIYKVTNTINGKAYIGFDCRWPHRRSVHICEGMTRKNKQYPLYRAINKYGRDAFVWEILYQSEDRGHTLNIMEPKLIKEHNTHYIDGHGYNMSYGGEGTFGVKLSEETKRKISEARKGHKWTEDQKKRLSDQRTGRKLSDYHKQRMSEVREKTYQFIKNGELITIVNLKKYAEENGLSMGNLNSVYHGKYCTNHYKGHYRVPDNFAK